MLNLIFQMQILAMILFIILNIYDSLVFWLIPDGFGPKFCEMKFVYKFKKFTSAFLCAIYKHPKNSVFFLL